MRRSTRRLSAWTWWRVYELSEGWADRRFCKRQARRRERRELRAMPR
jgi:hypothetical protein